MCGVNSIQKAKTEMPEELWNRMVEAAKIIESASTLSEKELRIKQAISELENEGYTIDGTSVSRIFSEIKERQMETVARKIALILSENEVSFDDVDAIFRKAKANLCVCIGPI